MTLIRISLIAATGVVLAAPASAVILDFSDIVTDQFGASIPSGGFNFTFDTQGWGILTNSFNSFNRVLNGTTTAAWSGNAQQSVGNGFMTFKPLDDSAFSMQSFDSAVFHNGFGNGSIQVTGFFEAGGSTSQNFTITNVWSPFVLNSTFVGLDRVEIRDNISGAFNTIPGVQIDNIKYNDVVPEPATMIAMGVGVAALLRRRRK